MDVITGKQMRIGRAVLGLTQMRFAELSGVSWPTIQRMEGMEGEVSGLTSTVRKIERTFAEGGVVFTEGGAVIRPRQRSATTPANGALPA